MEQETLKEAIKKHLYAKAFLADPDNTAFVDRFIEHTKAAEWGAEWQRNHVWHKNTEFPGRGIHGSGWGEQCLVKIKDEHQNIPIVAQANLANGYFYFCDNRGVWITMSNVDYWAYIDDLMPTSFDDILEDNKDVLQRLRDNQNG